MSSLLSWIFVLSLGKSVAMEPYQLPSDWCCFCSENISKNYPQEYFSSKFIQDQFVSVLYRAIIFFILHISLPFLMFVSLRYLYKAVIFLSDFVLLD